jgi:hypothetical protein
MQSWTTLILAWLLGIMPAQSREASRLAHMELQRSSDVCSALTPAECCAQMLEIAVFRATGDQVPKGAKAPVRLSCKDPDRTIPDNACRLIAMGRGFSARAAAELCAPGAITKRCADDETCKQCVSDLVRLDWKASQRACYALTYVPKVENVGTRIVTLEPTKKPANGELVRVRRLIMR